MAKLMFGVTFLVLGVLYKLDGETIESAIYLVGAIILVTDV